MKDTLVRWHQTTWLHFFAKSIKQIQLLFLNRRLLFYLIVQREEWHFPIVGWMKNRLRKKWNCCFNCILLKLNNVYPYIKRENINLTDWPCHAWLQKRVWPTNKATLGVCYWLLCTNLSDGNLGGIVFISDGQYVLWSQKVCWNAFSWDLETQISKFPSLVPSMGATYEILT